MREERMNMSDASNDNGGPAGEAAGMTYLRPDQHAAFARDGYLLLDGFLDRATVAAVEAEIAALARAAAGLVGDRGGLNLEKVGDAHAIAGAVAKRPGMLRKIQGAVFELPAVRQVFCQGRLVGVMAEVLGGRPYYHSSKVMLKPAGGGAAKPWHQDAAYWQQYSAEQITVWIAIHDADQENGCIWAIPGSHRLGLLEHHEVELQVRDSALDLGQAVPVPVRAGGLLLFHSLVLHKSERNSSSRDRWAIICDYDRNPNPSIDLPAGSGFGEHGVWALDVPN